MHWPFSKMSIAIFSRMHVAFVNTAHLRPLHRLRWVAASAGTLKHSQPGLSASTPCVWFAALRPARFIGN
jgi:hypothetical protein